MTQLQIADLLNLSKPFINKHSYINFERISKVLLSDKSTRAKKEWLYGTSISDSVLDTIWCKYCEAYVFTQLHEYVNYRENNNVQMNYSKIMV